MGKIGDMKAYIRKHKDDATWYTDLWDAWTGAKDRNIAVQNLELEKEQFQYAKDIQQEIFGREDTAMQRRVNDLRAAGLSPILAAGQGAQAGHVVATKAPQMRHSPQQKALGSLQMLTNMLAMQKNLAEVSNIRAQANRTRKETKYIDALRTNQIEKQEIDLQYSSGTLNDRITTIKNTSRASKYNYLRSQQDYFMSRTNADMKAIELRYAEIEQDLLLNSNMVERNKIAELDHLEKQVLYQGIMNEVLQAQLVGKKLDARVYKSIGIGQSTINAITSMFRAIR